MFNKLFGNGRAEDDLIIRAAGLMLGLFALYRAATPDDKRELLRLISQYDVVSADVFLRAFYEYEKERERLT